MNRIRSLLLALLTPFTLSAFATGEEETRTPVITAETPASAVVDPPTQEGHSVHGEVFNEGPRQAAYLMNGIGTVSFPVTTSSEEARRFLVQGVAQLHGFWYFESERSFRQAAMLDPECATAYWGMAASNRSNSKRAKGFSLEAMKRREKTSRRERLYIEAFDRYIQADASSDEDKAKRSEKYVSDLENLLYEFPEDNEARAFLCEFLWSARKELKLKVLLPVDAMIQDVLDLQPLHPIHHYRIHLWDADKPELALESAARCGLAAPGIAHMWHMPGHTYSKLHRYHDAVWQQEASARVDHAHMMKDRVLPDQIHNFAHNNEWCIRNMLRIGRINDAVTLAKNMISMPRHPVFNHIGKSGSYKFGRQRLREVLMDCGLYTELIQASESSLLDPAGDETEDLARDRALAVAFLETGRMGDASRIRTQLQEQLDVAGIRKKEAGDAAEKKALAAGASDKEALKQRQNAEEKHEKHISELQKSINEIDGRLAVLDGQFDRAMDLITKAEDVRMEDQINILLKAGKKEDALARSAEHVTKNPGTVLPLVLRVKTLWTLGRTVEAKAAFQELQKISSAIDIEIPTFAQLKPIAVAMGFPEDWTVKREIPGDIGVRPDLDTLGPFRWHPVMATPWTLPDTDGNMKALTDYRGKPVIVMFYLGYGCLHCVEQLKTFAPRNEDLRAAGLEIVAVSTDKQENLKRAMTDVDGGFPFPLLADPELKVFRDYRCFDDFEKTALHGTFLLDGDGRIRWQDISYQPFTDVDFLLKEAKRLLMLDQVTTEIIPAVTDVSP